MPLALTLLAAPAAAPGTPEPAVRALPDTLRPARRAPRRLATESAR